MEGEIGDTAVYYDRSGESCEAIISGESGNGNAILTFTEDGSWERSSIRVAVNIPSGNDRSSYEPKSDASWSQELLV